MKSDFKIVNLTATANLKVELDLKYLARNLWNAEYYRKINAMVLRVHSPNRICMVFKNGNINCIGSKSEESAHETIRICAW